MRWLNRLRVVGVCGLGLGLGWATRPVAAQTPPTLLSCYVIGDSLAVGTAQKLSGCGSNTKVGLNTKQALIRYPQLPATDVTIISLGINDRGSRLPTVRNLEELRQRIPSARVIWILPADATKSAEIHEVALAFHDQWINLNSPSFGRYLSRVDHLHPSGTGYALVAEQARALVRLGRNPQQ